MKSGKDYIGVGGGVLILDDKREKTLLIKRFGKVKNELGFWSKPGGAVELGERAVDAMKREIKEELNIDVDIWGYLPHTDHIIDKEEQYWVAFNFVASISGGELKNMEPHKCSEIKWFKLSELPEKITQTTREPVDNYLAGKFIKL